MATLCNLLTIPASRGAFPIAGALFLCYFLRSRLPFWGASPSILKIRGKGGIVLFEKQRTAALAKTAAAGDKQAFTALIDLYRQSLYATAMAVTRNEDDALDAIQQTLLILWEKLPDLRDPGAFKTWMTRILVNECRAILRARRREFPLEVLEEAAPAPDRDAALDVRGALEKLSQEDRLVLQLFYYEDLPVKDIAEALSLSQDAVRMRLSRGRKRFRKAYGEEGKQDAE